MKSTAHGESALRIHERLTGGLGGGGREEEPCERRMEKGFFLRRERERERRRRENRGVLKFARVGVPTTMDQRSFAGNRVKGGRGERREARVKF